MKQAAGLPESVVLEVEADLAKRSRAAGLAYIFLFACIWFDTTLTSEHPWEMRWTGLAMLLVAASRSIIAFAHPRFYPRHRWLWRNLFFGGAVASAMIWGAMAAGVIQIEGLTASSFGLLLSVVGIAGGATASLSPWLSLVRVYLCMILLPLVALSLIHHASVGYYLPTVSFAFFAFLWHQASVQHLLYWQAIRNRLTAVQLEQAKTLSIENSRLAALGRMAGGMAHEINTPLAAIAMTAENIQGAVEDGKASPDVLKAYCETIVWSCKRISKIITDMRAFARDSSKDPLKLTAVRELVGDAVQVCQNVLLEREIRIETEIPSDLFVHVRPDQLVQVLVNVINNAADAVAPREDRWIRVTASVTGSEVAIAVTDSGASIPMDVAVRIFDPFFTTKDIGQGTGLGLSAARGIMEAHQGSLILGSPGPNTQFILKLPNALLREKTAQVNE